MVRKGTWSERGVSSAIIASRDIAWHTLGAPPNLDIVVIRKRGCDVDVNPDGTGKLNCSLAPPSTAVSYLARL
jgi:hypothetical protein